MRLTRRKHYKRYVEFYRLNFGFIEPFHVIIDGSFIKAALDSKIHIKDQLPKLLGVKTKLYVTTCISGELKAEGYRSKGAQLIARGYQLHNCGHHFEGGNQSERCIRKITRCGNPSKFAVASQSPKLLRKLRSIGSVPLLRLRDRVPILDPPTSSAKSQFKKATEDKSSPQEWEKPHLLAAAEEIEKKKNKLEKIEKRRKKGINPLSQLRKKYLKEPRKEPTRLMPKNNRDAVTSASTTHSSKPVSGVVASISVKKRTRSKRARKTSGGETSVGT
eukprot:GHVQ01026981.1.p1 GENE.GHVQ01026981.1~~GHVQ01026981.1.p1  ORF type:complete len:275 (-),score=17.42 GHVQ01026981.1:586-1410(-)